MKNNYTPIKMSLLMIISFLTQNLMAQCVINYTETGVVIFNNDSLLLAQGFIAECDSDIDYVQFFSGDDEGGGTITEGTLNIYSGNDVTGTPIYTQSYPEITVVGVTDPIRVDVTGQVTLVEGEQYAFQMTINDAVDVFVDFDGGYDGGFMIQDDFELPDVDMLFEVSLKDTALSVEDFNTALDVNVFPNPSRDFIQTDGLIGNENYRIYNSLGAEVKSGTISDEDKIDINNFTNGAYFLKFDKRETVMIVKY